MECRQGMLTDVGRDALFLYFHYKFCLCPLPKMKRHDDHLLKTGPGCLIVFLKSETSYRILKNIRFLAVTYRGKLFW